MEPKLKIATGTEPEFEKRSEKGERPARLFQKGYTRKNKGSIFMPTPNFNTRSNETTMPSNDYSKINPEVHVSLPKPSISNTDSNFESSTLDP